LAGSRAKEAIEQVALAVLTNALKRELEMSKQNGTNASNGQSQNTTNNQQPPAGSKSEFFQESLKHRDFKFATRDWDEWRKSLAKQSLDHER